MMDRPVRILHVVGKMGVGGVETWLMNVFRRLDRSRFIFDFVVHDPTPSAYDAEIVALGGRILPCPRPQSPTYAWRLRSLLAHAGPFDVVHSHVHHFSGVVLAAARLAGVPVRVAHSHSASLPRGSSMRRLYALATEQLIRSFATDGLAASVEAARALFGRHWARDGRWRVQVCGIELSPFIAPSDSRALRASLNVPHEAIVVGHVGRFVPEKNHALILGVAAALRSAPVPVHVVLVGDGPLRLAIEGRATAMGLGPTVHFLGTRRDVPALLRVFDVFLFPSKSEGLGLAAVEAQAAGTPVVMSDAIPSCADVVPSLVTRCAAAAEPPKWASTLLAAARAFRPSQAEALSRVAASPFDIDESVRALTELYARAGRHRLSRHALPRAW